ncbi:tetratricopeptide repeat protein [Mariprofundus sp. KV]|uniref:tetratricopeptide repeat protein n=1 Tax=Mariprofundus sp. KV TaxID=2608715 RepID=UPI0015A253F5|nr:tetratricopeptide repeat protein [Mariprofundus sp. KV]NWF37321.1 tetratricopeptide repeat protein [Mariprofundus sp. KV]
MFRAIIIVTALILALPSASYALESERTRTVRIFLNNGNPEQAVRTAEKVLKAQKVTRDERQEILNLIAEAEIMRATHKHFENISLAVQAIEASLKEFPENPQAAELRWQKAWLRWKAGDHKKAVTAAREIITKDQQPQNLRRAWLLMARIHIEQEQFAYARSDLLQYSLQIGSDSYRQAIGMAWMAIVDQGEKRPEVAYKSLLAVHKNWQEIITSEPILYANFIQLMHNNEDKQTLALSEDFIHRYINSVQAPIVRLIHADIIADNNKTAAAIKEYGILSASQAETTIGRKAFIRKLMLEFKDETEKEKLLPAMVSLKKIADSNQLSLIEDEAMLGLAQFWARIEKASLATEKESAEERAESPALHAYARAATSVDRRIAQRAHKEGAIWLQDSLNTMLKQEQWLKAVTIWKQYPQLRPSARLSQELRLGIGHAMRLLMLFDGAEKLLSELYKSNKASIRGQRVMVELSKLWMDRQDSDGVEKVMRWLNRNEYTIYRPEILAVVARMQMNQKQAQAARQTLNAVRASDLALESRANFWRTSAEVSAALGHWHSEAKAWESYRLSQGADQRMGLLNQARSLFTAREYGQARKLYMEVAEKDRDAAWEYYVGVCQVRTGEIQQGEQRLQALAQRKDAGTYAALAKLALADQQAGQLLGEKQ